MARYLTGLVLIGIYAGWVLYRLIIKRDLARHNEQFHTATFIVAAMVATYCWITY